MTGRWAAWMGQGVVFGEENKLKPREGGYVARESIASDAWRSGAQEGEISQRDLGNHLKFLASLPAERLDGQEWGQLTVTEVRRGVRATLRVAPRVALPPQPRGQIDPSVTSPPACSQHGGGR